MLTDGSNNWAQPSMVSLIQEIIPHVVIPPVAIPLKVRTPLKTARRYLKNVYDGHKNLSTTIFFFLTFEKY